MKTKLEMAHEYLLRFSGTTVADAWRYADAMQVEAEKRKPSGLPESLRERHDFTEAIAKGVENYEKEEWQPDWSQAPDGYNWWAMDGFIKHANWYIDKPYLDDDSEIESEWNIDLKTDSATYIKAPLFNYQGNWQDSLRKRPNI